MNYKPTEKAHRTATTMENECLRCAKGAIKCALLPCGHAVTCDDCALRTPNCPVCDEPVRACVRSISYDAGSPICAMCADEKVRCLFLPCKHLVACEKCGASVVRCLVCDEQILATVNVSVL